MKKFFIFAIVACTAIMALSSCAKDNTVIPADLFSEEQTAESANIYSIDIQFDAPADLDATTIEFYDETGQGVAILSVPVSPDVEAVTFVSESRPAALYTPGLQNTNEDGVLPLPDSSVETKAGPTAVLLVIR